MSIVTGSRRVVRISDQEVMHVLIQRESERGDEVRELAGPRPNESVGSVLRGVSGRGFPREMI